MVTLGESSSAPEIAMRIRLLLVVLVFLTAGAFAAEQPIDVAHSTIRIHVGKAGVFSAAGHEHWVTAPITDGTIQEEAPAQISFRVQARNLKVEDDHSLSTDKQAEVQRTMQTEVLESDRYPEIRFRSTSIHETGPHTWEVRGDLNLHGETHPVTTAVHRQQNAYVGRCELKQTDFAIHPVRVGGGLVKVKDQLEIEFSIVPRQ